MGSPASLPRAANPPRAPPSRQTAVHTAVRQNYQSGLPQHRAHDRRRRRSQRHANADRLALLPDAIAEHSVQSDRRQDHRQCPNAVASPDRSRSVSSVASICRRMEITSEIIKPESTSAELAADGLQQCRLRARRHGSDRQRDSPVGVQRLAQRQKRKRDGWFAQAVVFRVPHHSHNPILDFVECQNLAERVAPGGKNLRAAASLITATLGAPSVS